jgi:hypothetical protein
MGIGRDYRKVPYVPKSGLRLLTGCIAMVMVGLGCLASQSAFDFLNQSRGVFGYHIGFGFVPIFLIGLGILNAVPAVMMLTPPSKR